MKPIAVIRHGDIGLCLPLVSGDIETYLRRFVGEVPLPTLT